MKLKVDRPHPRNYLQHQLITDTDNNLRLRHVDRNTWKILTRKAASLVRHESADGHTDGHTDRRYQAHYLPASLSYTVDNDD